MDEITRQKLTRACQFIEKSEELPSLSAVAGHISWSPAHFQKTFTRALGVSPRNYADAVRFDRLRKNLSAGRKVSGALYDSGFGGSSRLYEFAGRYLGMTPKNYQNKGKGQKITYALVNSSLGFLIVAATVKGICRVRLGGSKKELEEGLKKEFSHAEFNPQDPHLQKWVQALVNYLAGRKPWPLLPYDVQATAFQRRVWEWLCTIPPGTTYNYSEAAKAIGRPNAVRAVANACARNEVALVIPCHRIVPKSGGTGGYRWHPERKKKLLALENAKIR